MPADHREEDLFIRDRSSQQYRVHLLENAHWYLKVYNRKVRVAHANCHPKPPVLYVDDLHVEDAKFTPESTFSRLIRLLMNRQKQAVNYRRRGIATALLRLIADRAAARGFTSIEGSLSRIDLGKDPKLPEWYQRRGFTVLPGGRYNEGKVRLALSPTAPGDRKSA